MSEIRPQITFSPEGVLEVITGLTDMFEPDGVTSDHLRNIVVDRQSQLEMLAEEPGVVVVENDGIVKLSVNVDERFSSSFNRQGDPDIGDFLGRLDRLLPFHPEDQIDRIVGLDFISARGSNATINYHFQRWLNLGLSEDVARNSLLAMSLPFGEDSIKITSKNFLYKEFTDDRGEVADSSNFRLVARKQEFGISKREDNDI